MKEKIQYAVTKEQCQEKINALNNVCNRCGRKIIPLKTHDNSGHPSYWSGCMHGNKGTDAFGHFTHGVKKEVFDLAVKLVLEDRSRFRMDYEDMEMGDFDYAFQNAVYRNCDLIEQIEWMKSGSPRYTKGKLKKLYFTKKETT